MSGYTNAKQGDGLDSMIESCNVCARSKLTTQRLSGFLNPQSSVCFITANPLVDSKHAKPVFVANKSATMLQNMITNVFNLPLQSCSILSLVKCPIESTPHIDEVSMCIGFLHTQLEHITPKVIVLFGQECAQYVLGQNVEGVRDFRDYGRILWHNNRSFLLTYSLGEIVRNPSLKPQVMQHLLVAKGVLWEFLSLAVWYVWDYGQRAISSHPCLYPNKKSSISKWDHAINVA